ncbi:S1/P1 nuclease [Caulobacter sp. UNC358MFTsu5.1]|uniref:S1/P1 nuclease n=1 Tax=Caulobacter sp. UNC358MFTsu5.1 TaxID=1449049 RepID=UPI0004A71C13|nr:S1/P1 nuclease [Caulobacter sp. UNC358MFTsu5.1]
MRRSLIAAVATAALAVAALAPAPALAWNDQGHMATGDIAYDVLAERDPKAVAAIVALMRDHPDHAAFERQLAGLTGRARERRLFALMARWPDDTRGSPHDRPDWHYAVKVVSPWRFVMPLSFGHGERAFRDNLAIARDPRAPRADRAVALCWIMHGVGDLHQPLHAGHWMSWTFPKTDRAGTIAYVRWAPGGPSVDLHEFWDGVPNRPGGRDVGSEALAAAAEAAHPRPTGGGLGPDPYRAFLTWEHESWVLAKTVAYRDGALATGRTRAEAPVLPKGYWATARDLAELRIATAGYRLADVLALVRAEP